MISATAVVLSGLPHVVRAEEFPPAVVQPVDFAKDVQLIFARACIRCHGPQKQKSGYRLDDRKTAMKGGDAYAPNIVPGRSADSPLIQFVAGLGDVKMPPDGPPLSKQEVGILRRWIDQGARWPDSAVGKSTQKTDWWALQPIVSPPVPKIADPEIQNPIDAFIRAKLAERGIKPSPPADRETLIRRMHFDLTGLPPAVSRQQAAASDRAKATISNSNAQNGSMLPANGAISNLVDELLASPRYGERWARHWMDMAHFAETHGHDQDRVRENAWPYRDYLIESFNSDKPYSRFVQEQIAGDAMFPNDPAAIVAMGFLSAGPWDESSLRDIREDTLDRQIARYIDRDDMVATAMNNLASVTVQCARCHDHKFDPISQSDHYALQAVFAGVERGNRSYDRDPAVSRQRRELLARRQAMAQREPSMVRSLLASSVQQSVSAWEKSRTSRQSQWTTVRIESAKSSEGSTLTIRDDGSILATGKRPERDTYTIISTFPAGKVTGVRLEVLTDPSLPAKGPGRAENGNLHLSEFEISVDLPKKSNRRIARVSADFNQVDWSIEKAIDGDDQTAWGIHPKVGQPHEAAFELAVPIAVSQPVKVRFVFKQLHGRGHTIGRFRLSTTDSPTPIRINAVPDAIAAIFETPSDKRSESQRLELAIFQQIEAVDEALLALPKPAMVYAAASDFEPDGSHRPSANPRAVYRLNRGDINQPRELAKPGTLACVSALSARFDVDPKAGEAARRVALAKWLTDPRNPLVWRSIVNRVWQYHFGRGLVSTPNDFGKLGDTPSHPELLDWLAADFRDNGQSLKRLHRMIATSATYRQSSRHVPEYAAIDADNRLLWRMNRLRLDAECVRDAVLAISGQLDLRMGGPSDRQFDLKAGIHVTPTIDYSKFNLESPAGRRRSVYRFLFRTLPDPFMETLDCPAGDQITSTRTNSVTVQQALAMWNDAFIARQCEHMAKRLETSRSSTSQRVDLAVRLAWGREPNSKDLSAMCEYANRHGMANLCRVLTNANEFLFTD